MTNLIDFHFHLDYYEDYRNKYKYINNKLIYTLCMTNMPELYEANTSIFKVTKYVKFALGFNPQLAGSEKFNKSIFNKYLASTKYIGEVGLDYSREHISSKNKQKEIFEYICSVVADKNKIMSIHSRNAEEDVLSILVKNKIKYAIFHWYTGSLSTLEKIIKEGYYVSVNSSMMKTKKGLEIIKSIPLDRILVESDGPFTKVGNKVAEPENLHLTYNELSKILGLKSDELVNKNLKTLLCKSIE